MGSLSVEPQARHATLHIGVRDFLCQHNFTRVVTSLRLRWPTQTEQRNRHTSSGGGGTQNGTDCPASAMTGRSGRKPVSAGDSLSELT